jgi:hypothetical protein
LANKLEMNPHPTAWRFTLSVGVSPQSATTHTRKGLGVKCYRLRWVPYLHDEFQKAERLPSAHLMLKVLDKHARTNDQYFLTGDELWMMNDQILLKMWTLDRDHLDPILHRSRRLRKTMVAVFFGVNGIGLVKILPQGQKVTSDYFKDAILHAIYRGSLGGWRLGRRTHLTLSFDNAPVHNAKGLLRN